VRTPDKAFGPAYTKAMARLQSLNWEEQDRPVFSGFALLGERIRRGLLWQKQLNVRDLSPLEDTAALLDPSLNVEDAVVERALSGRSGHYGLTYIRIFTYQYLKWAMAQDRGLTSEIELPDPFEPWFRLNERGQLIGQHHGELNIGGQGAMSIHRGELQGFLARPPLMDLSEEALERYDLEVERRIASLPIVSHPW
jgi:hypothetical protein